MKPIKSEANEVQPGWGGAFAVLSWHTAQGDTSHRFTWTITEIKTQALRSYIRKGTVRKYKLKRVTSTPFSALARAETVHV
jgi:hypothetical protein